MCITSVFKITAIVLNLGLIWIMLAYTFDMLWLSVGLIFAYRKFGLKITEWKLNLTLARSIFSDSWPLMLSGAAISIYMKIYQVMIGKIIGERQVGLYAAAVKISEIWYFIPIIICASVFPAIVNSKNDPPLYKKRLRNLYWLMFSLAASLAIPISLLAKPIVSVIFGPGFLPSAGALQIHIWAGIGIFLGVALSQYLISENLNIINFIMTLSSAVLNIILNLFLIKSWGINGAAFATLVSYLSIPVSFFIYTSISSRLIKT